jgi:hypothetical protein
MKLGTRGGHSHPREEAYRFLAPQTRADTGSFAHLILHDPEVFHPGRLALQISCFRQ